MQDERSDIECNFDCENIVHYDSEKRSRLWENRNYRQLFLLLVLVSNMFSGGACYGTITVLIPQLRNEDALMLTKEMESWLYSVHSIATLPSIILLPIMMERCGRRWVYSTCAAINAVGWSLQYFANTFTMYLIAEILQGISIASNYIVGIMYISECSDPKKRGIFLVFKTASFVWGIWMANTIGTFSDTRNAMILGWLSALFTCIGMIFLPESPVWLAGKGRYQNCKNSFLWLRGRSSNSEKELKQLIAQYPIVDAVTKRSQTLFESFLALSNQIRLKEFYLPLMLSVICFAIYQFCGKIAISIYALVILKDITQDMALAYKVMLIIDAISVVGMYSGCYLVFKLKRRVMLFTSTLAAAFCMLVMSILLFLNEYHYLSVSHMTMLVLLGVYSFVVSLGPMTLPSSIFAEIVPHKFKTSISSGSTLAMFGMQFSILKCNPYFMQTIALRGIFILYATISSLCILFLYFFLPETKDRTLTEIENNFVSIKQHSDDVCGLKEAEIPFTEI